MNEINIGTALRDYQSSLCKELDIIALLERNRVAHKWKVTYQSMCLRETVAWRFVDIANQSWFLHENNSALGARILLRSALETLAILIYLNQLTRKVVEGNISFTDYQEKTYILLSGSRDGTTDTKACNIVTILQKCEKKYEGIEALYGSLSESAHPNYEGMRVTYSVTDQEKMLTTFVNKACDLYSTKHEYGVLMAITIFEHEYNHEWEKAFESLEVWLVKNDKELNS